MFDTSPLVKYHHRQHKLKQLETLFYGWFSETNTFVLLQGTPSLPDHWSVTSCNLKPKILPVLGVKPEPVDTVGKIPIKALNCELAENCELVQGWGTYRHACNPARLRLPA